ncbi:MAG: TnsA endonuclease N-terminal domain-containing protein [Ardenticatenaceae bacterium]|nr:TnsA endonuclease N-terminal domain-containing protein [Anaerolineales bacterium]MCB8919981.1 TnsA endonuclease N-terminal domain-containing protein [Ardenticatenaceae bacterium]MCB8989828.1 TnsA endonuclease N-terminal domain-containing protein [Ardenticatenaceae bacterium]
MPVRKRKISYGRNIIGHFPSIKMDRMIFYESLIERDVIRCLDYDPSVFAFEEQPLTIDYEFESKQYHYTPDFKVETDDDIYLIECKSRAHVDDEENSRKYAAADQYCRAQGWAFLIITDQLLRNNYRVQNIEHLTYYARHHVPSNVEMHILQTLRNHNDWMRLQDLMTAVSPGSPVAVFMPIMYLAYHHHVFIALENAPISQESLVCLAAYTPISHQKIGGLL